MGEQSRFALGMTLGLLGVGFIVLWERVVFTGPFYFAGTYRVAGTFSALSTAGAQLESYLSAATPFAMLIALRERRVGRRLLALAALVLTLYAVAATVSRSAYAGVGVAAGTMALAWLWSAKGLRPKLAMAVLLPVFLFASWVLITGTSIAQRLAGAHRDLSEREAHWSLVLDLKDARFFTGILGMGVGQYPPTFLWKAPPDRRPGTFAFLHENGADFLRLNPGHSVYIDQFVPVMGEQRYFLHGSLRATIGADATIATFLCEKWILYAIDCRKAELRMPGTSRWEAFTITMDSMGLGSGPPLLRRPIKLSLANGPTGGVVEVTDLRLEGIDGRNIVENGNFAHDGDHWYFSADDHFPWNIF